MSLDDRDYMQEESGFSPIGWLTSLSMTGRLILINVVVFLVWLALKPGPGLASPFMQAHFTVSAVGLLDELKLWTVFTYAFSQTEPIHLLFNMIVLWVFCPELETIYGKRNVAFLYLFGAFGCALGHVGLNMVWGHPATPMLGASGSVMATVAVMTLIAPTRRLLLFGIIPMPLWALAGLFLIVDLFGMAGATQGHSSGIAHAGHLGGAAAGIAFKLLDLRLFRGEGQDTPSTHARWFKRRPKLRVLPPLPKDPEQRAPSLQEQEQEQAKIDADTATRVDDLLRKINDEGMASLSPEERAFLEEASLKYKR